MTAGPMSTDTASELTASLAQLPAVSLADLMEFADLQVRVDRKYIVPANLVSRFAADALPRAAVLTIDGHTIFGYESVYFDTLDLVAYRAAAHGRRRRFKVRTRTYLDSGSCMLEVKTVGGRGETVKRRVDHRFEDRATITSAARYVLQQSLGDAADVSALRPTLTTTYHRSTLVDPEARTRVTVDVGLVCAAPDGSSAALDDHVIVETKSPGGPTPADRWLWSAGHRPVKISKYCTGLAALDGSLPANTWTRTLRRYFDSDAGPYERNWRWPGTT